MVTVAVPDVQESERLIRGPTCTPWDSINPFASGESFRCPAAIAFPQHRSSLLSHRWKRPPVAIFSILQRLYAVRNFLRGSIWCFYLWLLQTDLSLPGQSER